MEDNIEETLDLIYELKTLPSRYVEDKELISDFIKALCLQDEVKTSSLGLDVISNFAIMDNPRSYVAKLHILNVINKISLFINMELLHEQ